MSNDTPDKDLDLDLHFLPSWAQESPEINRYANYEGERGNRRFNDDRRGGPRSGGGGGGGGDRARGGRSQGSRPGGDRPRGDRPPGAGGGAGGGRGPSGPRRDQQDRRGGRPAFERRVEIPMPEVNLRIIPDDRGVDSLTKQIRMTGRAYPLFDIARLVLQKDDRYQIEFSTRKNQDGTVAQPLFVCALDDTAWLSQDDAVEHILNRHLATFYEVRRTPTDPPKGTYTFVAQCGMSGVILGPPNYHDYQSKLHQLHNERFSRLSFENFKSRVKIVRDEEVVKKWIDEQSFKTEFVVLNVPEPLVLGSFEEVQKHFRGTHMAEMVKSVDVHVVAGEKSRRVGSRELQRYVFSAVDEQKRFPLKLVTTLSQKFSTRGLHFFKVKKSIVHVAVARPHFLDVDATPVSDGVRKIVDYVNEHSRCSVKELVDVLAPTPAKAQVEPEPARAVEPAEAAASTEGSVVGKAVEHHEPTSEQKKVLADLHWLVHQGHVIEFASGELETAKKPHPKPQPKKKAAVAKAAVPEDGAAGVSEKKPDASPTDVAAEAPAVSEPGQDSSPVSSAVPRTDPASTSEAGAPADSPVPAPDTKAPVAEAQPGNVPEKDKDDGQV